jgi:hypothetical protein
MYAHGSLPAFERRLWEGQQGCTRIHLVVYLIMSSMIFSGTIITTYHDWRFLFSKLLKAYCQTIKRRR